MCKAFLYEDSLKPKMFSFFWTLWHDKHFELLNRNPIQCTQVYKSQNETQTEQKPSFYAHLMQILISRLTNVTTFKNVHILMLRKLLLEIILLNLLKVFNFIFYVSIKIWTCYMMLNDIRSLNQVSNCMHFLANFLLYSFSHQSNSLTEEGSISLMCICKIRKTNWINKGRKRG